MKTQTLLLHLVGKKTSNITHGTLQIIPYLLLISISISTNAQKRAHTWYFGGSTNQNGSVKKCPGVRIDSTGLVNIYNDGKMFAEEGSAAICDCFNGDILFYTEGDEVWNANHNTMVNGINLGGDPSGNQSSVVVPWPNRKDLYFIFTVDGASLTLKPGFNKPFTGNLSYSVVDMSLNNGLGEVILKNQLISTMHSENIAAVHHANGCDVWLASAVYGGTDIYAFKVSENGIDTVPVISSVGVQHPCCRAFKFSPNGERAASQFNGEPYLFDFNDTTGVFSNPQSLVDPNPAFLYYMGWPIFDSIFEPQWIGGNYFEFSSNSNVLYYQQTHIIQWNLNAGGGDIDSIRKSWVNIGQGMDLRLAADERIYVNSGGAKMHIIKDPNVPGLGCNYVTDSFHVAINQGYKTGRSAPNFIESYFDPGYKFLCAKAIVSDDTVCAGQLVSFYDSSVVSYGDSYLWDFGDGNYDTIANPTHIYSTKGIYNVTLEISRGCKKDSVYLMIVVNKPTLLISSDTTICENSSVQINAGGGASYFWSPGGSLNDSTISNPIASPVDSINTYHVLVTDSNGCQASDSVIINVIEYPTIQPMDDTTVCEATPLTLSVNAGWDYLWNTADTTSAISFFAQSTATYSVTVSNGNCAVADTAIITVVPQPALTIAGDSTICNGTDANLTASAGSTFVWSSGHNTQSINVSPDSTTTYYLTISDGICTATALHQIVVGDIPELWAIGDTAFCPGGTAYLTASSFELIQLPWPNPYAYDTFGWSTGEDTCCISVSPDTTTWYYATGTNWCGAATDSVLVTVHPLPYLYAGEDQTISIGDEVNLEGSYAETWFWSPARSLSCENCQFPVAAPTETTTYTLLVTNEHGCEATDDVTIFLDDFHSLYIPNAFTPNGDGLNDIFKAKGINIQSYQLLIFNRWGEVIFKTNNLETGWDGSFNGNLVQNGVYPYRLEYEPIGKGKEFEIGSVTLVK